MQNRASIAREIGKISLFCFYACVSIISPHVSCLGNEERKER